MTCISHTSGRRAAAVVELTYRMRSGRRNNSELVTVVRDDVSHAVGASSQLSIVTVVRPCPEVRLLVKGTDESADDGADDGGDDDDADDGATKMDYRHCYCDRCV